MSKIATYSLADTPLQLSDRLIGTEAPRPTPSATPLATKNFSLGELLQLFSSNFPAATLQAVLDAGNIATQNITLTGTIDVTLIKPDNIEDTSGSQGLPFQFLSKGALSINWVNLPVDNLQAVLNAGNTATQSITLVGNITSTRIIPGNIQDDTTGIGTAGQFLSKTASGIRWVNAPTSTTPGLGDVLSVGNTATNNINLTGNVTATSFIKAGGTNLQYLMADGSVTTGIGATPTLQQVTDASLVYSVAQTTNPILIGSFDGVNGNGAYLDQEFLGVAVFNNGLTSGYGMDYNGFRIPRTDGVSQFDSFLQIASGPYSASYNWALPLASGTIALTSDIPTSSGIPHATAAGTDTYTATVTGVASYSDGDAYLIRFTNGNTTSATLNINSIGAIPLYRNNDGVLIGGDIIDGGEMLCVYNSTTNRFQVIGTAPNSLFSYVTNADSVTLTKGMPVYAFGGTGDRMTVKRAFNTGDATSAQTVGLVLSTSIATNQKGLIMMQGLLDGLNILPTSTWADGDPVYLGATAGTITNIKPYAPNHLVYLGVVTTASNGSAGRMYVRVQNGYELDELHNVQAQSPTLKDTLWYDNTVTPAQWKTASIATILGYTPQQQLSGTGFVKISGTTISYDNSTYYLASNPSGFTSNLGTVTSVSGAGTVAGLTLTGTVTSTGSLTLGGTLSTPISTINDSTAVGQNFVKLTNPSAITFVRINADNTISTLDASTFRTAIGAGTSSTNGTVTSVSALTLGTTGTDLSSSVATGTTTPVITLNVPTANASSRGALSSADWSTFNAKQFPLIKQGYTTLTSVTGTQVLASLLIPANWLASGDGIEIVLIGNKSVTAGAIGFLLYHDTTLNGTTNAITTATSLGTSQRLGFIQRILSLSGTTLYNCLPVNATSLFPTTSTTVGATTTFNPAVNNYITLTVNPTVGTEVTGFNQFFIRKL